MLLTAAASGIAQSAARSDGMAQLPRTWHTCPANVPTASVAPFPQLHPNALQARVPIMMYHDILPAKKVAYDLTPNELRQHFERLKANQMTPISLAQLMAHLRTGSPLPKKSILLTFDDGYGGHYQYAYPLLKEYGYPAVFSIHTSSVGVNAGRTHVSWQELRTMAHDSLVTIASHSKTHPVLTKLSNQQLVQEVADSKKILESRLGRSVQYFTYPYGLYDARVKRAVANANYLGAIAYAVPTEGFANQSPDLLSLARFEKSQLDKVIPQAWSGPPTQCK
ncbi:polysaccharide deacetylase family protein [Trichocoleus sp. FACHB-591]|uniref:polysaccharide deacetylase family protein n=1 Tax=Trichocoleus sp. FACHB-591 TaxID=2692872 RepID=UPI0018EFAA5B|nr:polysaccharide deacetylase family protein [Trichocoleus sp. FACHB-591]